MPFLLLLLVFICLTFLTFSPRLASFFSRWKRPTRDERFSQNHSASSVSVSFFSPRAPHDPTSDNIRLFARERHALLFTPHDTLSTVARSDFSPRLHVRLLRRDVLPGKISASKSKGGDDNDFVVGKYVEDKIQRVIEHCMQMAVSTNHRVKEVTVLLHFYEKTMTMTTKKTSKNNSASNSHNSSPRGGAGTSSSSWKNGISGGGAATTSSLTNRMRNEDNAQAKKFGRKWETWQISLEMWDEDSLLVNSRGESMEKQRERAANDLAETLSGTMTHILALCEEKKEHVPAVTTERMPSFPFEIELVEIDGLNSRGGSGSQGGVFSSSFGMLKKLLKDSTPTQLI